MESMDDEYQGNTEQVVIPAEAAIQFPDFLGFPPTRE
jgi:hypothetical protein